MLNPSLSEPKLLKAVLKPLLEDFQYWFKGTRELLEQERLSFLTVGDQADLLSRVRKTQQQVTVAQSLLEATEGEAGVEMDVLMPWHQLVLECWQVTMGFRRQQSEQLPSTSSPWAQTSLENSPPSDSQAA